MTNEVEQPVKPLAKKKRAPILWKSIGILFALFAVAVLIYLSYEINIRFIAINQQLVELADTTESKLQQLQTAITEVQKNSNDSIQDLTTKVAQIQITNKDEWILAEAQYLVKLANDKAQFENNMAMAIILLKMADKKISSLTDPQFDAIRKALAVDIKAFESVAKVDVTGLYMRLSAVNEKVDQLPLINKPTTITPIHQAGNQQEKSWWQQGLENTWQSLRQIVVVRYNETGKLPLIPPDLQFYFYQNLHAMILQAVWGLLHGDRVIYKNSVEQAAAWIKEYCVENSPITQSMVTELSELEKIDIHPAAPAITSLQAFPGMA